MNVDIRPLIPFILPVIVEMLLVFMCWLIDAGYDGGLVVSSSVIESRPVDTNAFFDPHFDRVDIPAHKHVISVLS